MGKEDNTAPEVAYYLYLLKQSTVLNRMSIYSFVDADKEHNSLAKDWTEANYGSAFIKTVHLFSKALGTIKPATCNQNPRK